MKQAINKTTFFHFIQQNYNADKEECFSPLYQDRQVSSSKCVPYHKQSKINNSEQMPIQFLPFHQSATNKCMHHIVAQKEKKNCVLLHREQQQKDNEVI